jgi:hypothetical protein
MSKVPDRPTVTDKPTSQYMRRLIISQLMEGDLKCSRSDLKQQSILYSGNIYCRKLEFISNLTHNFIYSIIILHHDPQQFSSIAVLIFRRTIVYLQYLVSSHSVWQHTGWDDTRYCKYTIVLLKMSTAMLETC